MTQFVNMMAGLPAIHPAIIALLIIWTFIWKGLALWRAAGLRHKGWFVFILILNTFGIVEIIYLLFVARKYKVEVMDKNE